MIRSWRWEDAAAIVRHANNRKVWIHLQDAFPYPYTLADAEEFLRKARRADPEAHFAIAVGEEAVGAIGLRVGEDIYYRSAEIGYWLGEAYWGRGIATAALKSLTEYAVAALKLCRVFGLPFTDNVASCRVLEKAGYVREAILRRSAVKDGVIKDQALYAFVVE